MSASLLNVPQAPAVRWPQPGRRPPSAGPAPAPAPAPKIAAAATPAKQAIQDFILTIPPMRADPSAPHHQDGATSTVQEIVNGVVFKGTSTPMATTQNFSEIVAANPNADALWPGCLVQTKPLINGDLAPIGLSRGPATITLTTPFFSANLLGSRTLPNPTLSAAQQAIHDMTASTFGAPTPASLSSSSTIAESLEQGMLDVGVDVKFVSGDIKAKFSISQSHQTSSVVVRLTQAYYTVAMDAPLSPSAVFSDSVTVDDLKTYAAPDNPPAYVASVTYGRALLFVFQANVDKTELKASVDALIKAGNVDVNAGISGQYSSTLKQTQVQVWAVGGPAVDALNLTDPTQLQNYIQHGANFSANSPGLPISCQVRHLRDNSLVTVSSAARWVEQSDLTGTPASGMFSVGLGKDGGKVVDTGITVLPADRVSFNATGSIWSGVWLTGTNGPTGWYTWDKPGQAGFPMMDKHPFCLIGLINNTPFYIGDNLQYFHDPNQQAQPGRLFLEINSNNLQNGSGHLNVSVNVQRAGRR
jgi:hypothetical protein